MKNVIIICAILLITTNLMAKPKWWRGRRDLKIKRVVSKNDVRYYKKLNPVNDKVYLYETKYMIEECSEFRIIYFENGYKKYTVEYYPINNKNVYNIKYIIEYDKMDRLDGYYTKLNTDGTVFYEKRYKHGKLEKMKVDGIYLALSAENLNKYK